MNHRSLSKTCPTGESAKIALRVEIEAGRASGLLAFVDDEAVGWCAVDSVTSQIGHDYCMQKKEASFSPAWMIHCLYVNENYRGMGVSVELTKAAIALAKERGASEIIAFPIPENSAGKFPKDVAEFSGRFSTFKKLGFEARERLGDFYQVVSKPL